VAASRKTPTYAEASAELEEILEKIETGEADVDEVVALVRRGAELIRFCRERLDAARLEVGKVVADLDALEKEAAGEAEDADEEAEEGSDDAEAAAGGKLPF
jgi:exodeoxyribonuclease VII small subunit